MTRLLLFLLAASLCFGNTINSLTLVADLEQKPPVINEKVAAYGLPLIESDASFLKTLAASAIGQPLDFEKINELKLLVEKYYEEKGASLVSVCLPPQEITSGDLCLVVEEAKIGTVTFTGNDHFKTSLLEKYTHLQPGMPLDQPQLLSDLAWMNQNPFRRTDAVLSPGSGRNMTDVLLVTTDRRPYRFYTGTDNTGTQEVVRDRYFGGFTYSNLFGLDHQLSYQFTASYAFKRFWANTVEYKAPLPWRHTFVFIGNYSHVIPKKVVTGLASHGHSWTAEGRYHIPFSSLRWNLLHDFSFGVDFKQTNNSIEFGGFLVERSVADIIQAVVGYNLGYRTPQVQTTLNLQMYISPGNINHPNSTREFQKFRFGARSHYVYGKGQASVAWNIPGRWTLSLDASGQWSTANLFPTEMAGLGGYSTVRGYEERQLNVDMDVNLNLELRTPTTRLFLYGKTQDELYFLAFLDYGRGWFYKHEPGNPAHRTLVGIGPGVRYKIATYLSARFDYGFGLTDGGFINHKLHRPHFGVTLSY